MENGKKVRASRRKYHIKYGDRKQYRDFLKEIHFKLLNNG